jgi:hypothetical protein
MFRRLPTEVVVRTGEGEHRRSADYAHGDPWAEGFEMSDEKLFAKVRNYTEGFLPPQKADQLIDAVMSLDRAADVGTVVAAFVK